MDESATGAAEQSTILKEKAGSRKVCLVVSAHLHVSVCVLVCVFVCVCDIKREGWVTVGMLGGLSAFARVCVRVCVCACVCD